MNGEKNSNWQLLSGLEPRLSKYSVDDVTETRAAWYKKKFTTHYKVCKRKPAIYQEPSKERLALKSFKKAIKGKRLIKPPLSMFFLMLDKSRLQTKNHP